MPVMEYAVIARPGGINQHGAFVIICANARRGNEIPY